MTMPSNHSAAEPDPFLQCRQPPAHLIDSEGQYAHGWYPHFTAVPNVESSAAPRRRLQYWFHLHAESSAYYISANLAQLGLVGNVSLLIIRKSDGKIEHHSEKKWLWSNRIRQTGGCSIVWDPNTGSTITQNTAGHIEFRIQTEQAHWVGEARPALGPAFVQSSPGAKGFGSLQWWGPIRLMNSHLRMNEGTLELDDNILGGFDRTIGHRHRRQYWNWLCTQGSAIGPKGKLSPFAIQIAVDNLRNSDTPNPRKFNLWIHDRLHKFEEAEFMPGPQWEITAHGKQSAQSLRLDFTPQWRREERSGHPAVFGGHFRQLFGPIRGTLIIDDNRYLINEPFALVEDSRLSV